MNDPQPLPRLHGPLLPFLAMLLFAALFFAATRMVPAQTAGIENARVIALFEKYLPLTGVAFGLLSLLLMYLLFGLKALLGMGRSGLGAPVVLMLGYAPWAAFGYQLLYREPRYAMIAKAIIAFLGQPLMLSGMAMTGLGLVWFFFRLFKRAS